MDLQSSRVQEECVSVTSGAAMVITTAGTGLTRPTALVRAHNWELSEMTLYTNYKLFNNNWSLSVSLSHSGPSHMREQQFPVSHGSLHSSALGL